MNRPLVTIIVPCYNYGHFLGLTLENVQSQEYTHWECIVVDDGSTDDTAEVARRFATTDPRFRYIHQPNKGLAAARNTGIQHSLGSYVQLLDSDDLIHPAKLIHQVDILEFNPHIDITYGKGLFFTSEDPANHYPSRKLSRFHRPRKLQVSGSGKKVLRKLVINNIMAVSCALIRRSTLAAVGNFDETYKSYEDWHFWIRCALHDCWFDYSPVEGTDTYIRSGHPSMMTNKKKLTTYGIQLRKYLHPHLDRLMKVYNSGRLCKLYARKIFNIY